MTANYFSSIAYKNSVVNAGPMKQIKILVPSIELQTQCGKTMEQTEATKAKMQQSLQEMDNQFQALQHRAFKGSGEKKTLPPQLMRTRILFMR